MVGSKLLEGHELRANQLRQINSPVGEIFIALLKLKMGQLEFIMRCPPGSLVRRYSEDWVTHNKIEERAVTRSGNIYETPLTNRVNVVRVPYKEDKSTYSDSWPIQETEVLKYNWPGLLSFIPRLGIKRSETQHT